MWQCDLTIKLSWGAGWWRWIVQGGTPEVEATFRSQLLIMRMKGRQTLFSGCCTRCMLCLGYAVLGVYVYISVNSWLWHREIERDDLTLCSVMMAELWMRKREIGDEDESDVADTSEYKKWWVRLACSDWKDVISVQLQARSGLVPPISVILNWLADEILLSPNFS